MSHYKTLKPTYGKLTIMFFSVVGTLYVAGSVVRVGKFIRDTFNSDSLLSPCPLVGCVYAQDEVRQLPSVVYGTSDRISDEEIDKVIKQLESKKTVKKQMKYTGTQQSAVEAIKKAFPDNWADAVRVSTCESSLGLYPVSKTSTAKGLFHILNGTWKGHKCTGDPLNHNDNAMCARKIFNKYGWMSTASWNASLGCHKLYK